MSTAAGTLRETNGRRLWGTGYDKNGNGRNGC